MLMPFIRAASNMLVPAGTRIGCPSSVMSSIPGGGAAVVMLRANPNALRFASSRCGCETDAAGTLALQNVRVDFSAKMFYHRLNRRGHDLAKAADRSKAHGLREFVEQCEIGSILR